MKNSYRSVIVYRDFKDDPPVNMGGKLLIVVSNCGDIFLGYGTSKGVILDEPYGFRIEHIKMWAPFPTGDDIEEL